MAFGSKKEAPRRYEGRLLTVDTVEVPEGKKIKYGDAVIIRSECNKPMNRSASVPDAMEVFRQELGCLDPYPDAVIGLRIVGYAITPAEMVIVSGTPVWFE